MMKKIKYMLFLTLALPFMLSSCLKEDNVSAPVIGEIKTFMTDSAGKDSLITEIFKGKKIKIKDAFIAMWTLVKYRFID